MPNPLKNWHLQHSCKIVSPPPVRYPKGCWDGGGGVMSLTMEMMARRIPYCVTLGAAPSLIFHLLRSAPEEGQLSKQTCRWRVNAHDIFYWMRARSSFFRLVRFFYFALWVNFNLFNHLTTDDRRSELHDGNLVSFASHVIQGCALWFPSRFRHHMNAKTEWRPGIGAKNQSTHLFLLYAFLTTRK